jgi:bifunctional DNA-binding transcriptional regulator/antitoxin component of YhaV-PrlF toxin-antitoxin module
MTTVKITSKRQVVLPGVLCEEMRVGPGDRLEVEPVEVGGERLWALKPACEPDLPAFGLLRKYVKGKTPDWRETRRRLEDAWAEEGAS